jgi:Major tropism determinant N-terminal domain
MPTPYRQLQLRRGVKASLPALADGEPGFCEDTGELFVGSTTGNQKANAAYTAAAPSHWNGSPPTDVYTAIDRLAAAVAGLLGGPIP